MINWYELKRIVLAATDKQVRRVPVGIQYANVQKSNLLHFFYGQQTRRNVIHSRPITANELL
jgi:hypothetical protein